MEKQPTFVCRQATLRGLATAMVLLVSFLIVGCTRVSPSQLERQWREVRTSDPANGEREVSAETASIFIFSPDGTFTERKGTNILYTYPYHMEGRTVCIDIPNVVDDPAVLVELQGDQATFTRKKEPHLRKVCVRIR